MTFQRRFDDPLPTPGGFRHTGGADPRIPHPGDAEAVTAPSGAECWVCGNDLAGQSCLRLANGEHVCTDCCCS
jgi:hypothetical protein